MKHAHVFKYSQVILTERRLAILEFSKHSGLNPQAVAAIAINEEKPNGIIDQYKIGKLTTEEFRIEMNKLIENAGGKAVTDDKIFDNAWNSMCVVEEETLIKLYALQQEYSFHTHIIGGANELQHNYIQQKIQEAPKKPSISYTLSYEVGTLDKDLLKENANNYLNDQGYEPIWHTDLQDEYKQNAMQILGEYYKVSSGYNEASD